MKLSPKAQGILWFFCMLFFLSVMFTAAFYVTGWIYQVTQITLPPLVVHLINSLGGLFLMLPGLISDALGLLLLIPPVQKALSAYAERTVTRRLSTTTPGTLGDAFQQARIHRPDGKVVQGEVIREDGTRPDTPRDERPPLTY